MSIYRKPVTSNNFFIMGDFNLDANMEHRLDYTYRIPLNLLIELAIEINLTQIVTCNTWSPVIKGIKKESRLDLKGIRHY